MNAFSFNYRDILRAPRLALSLQKMWIQLVGLGVGYGIYLFLTYLSFFDCRIKLE